MSEPLIEELTHTIAAKDRTITALQAENDRLREALRAYMFMEQTVAGRNPHKVGSNAYRAFELGRSALAGHEAGQPKCKRCGLSLNYEELYGSPAALVQSEAESSVALDKGEIGTHVCEPTDDLGILNVPIVNFPNRLTVVDHETSCEPPASSTRNDAPSTVTIENVTFWTPAKCSCGYGQNVMCDPSGPSTIAECPVHGELPAREGGK